MTAMVSTLQFLDSVRSFFPDFSWCKENFDSFGSAENDYHYKIFSKSKYGFSDERCEYKLTIEYSSAIQQWLITEVVYFRFAHPALGFAQAFVGLYNCNSTDFGFLSSGIGATLQDAIANFSCLAANLSPTNAKNILQPSTLEEFIEISPKIIKCHEPSAYIDMLGKVSHSRNYWFSSSEFLVVCYYFHEKVWEISAIDGVEGGKHEEYDYPKTFNPFERLDPQPRF